MIWRGRHLQTADVLPEPLWSGSCGFSEGPGTHLQLPPQRSALRCESVEKEGESEPRFHVRLGPVGLLGPVGPVGPILTMINVWKRTSPLQLTAAGNKII